MKNIIIAGFAFFGTLSILIWMTINSVDMNEHSSYGSCNEKNESISKSHKEFLLEYGWHIKSKCSSSNKILNYHSGLIETLQSGGLNLEPYNKKGKEVKITNYTLQEKQQDGDKISAVIYEIDGKIVGGHGTLENWDPGIFSLDEKERIN